MGKASIKITDSKNLNKEIESVSKEIPLNDLKKYDSSENKQEFIKTEWLSSKFQIMKNLIVIGFAWMFLFTAYQSVANLQSSLNKEEGLGTSSLSTIYITLVISCLFLPPIMIRNIGLKWTIVASQAAYLLYIAANIYARWYTLIPAAIILGLGAAPLWTAKCTYLSEIAEYYSYLTNEKKEMVVNRFFGIFFAMFQTTQIWGNILSSTVLKQETNSSNSSVIRLCGRLDCPIVENINKTSSQSPNNVKLTTIYILCGIYVIFALISMLLITFLLSSYKRKEIKEDENKSVKQRQLSLVISTIKHLKKPSQLLVIPITFWLGFEQAFIGADFTSSFVTCSMGINYVGYTMICYGVVDVLGSYLFGILIKYIGRVPCFLIAATFNYAMIFLMIFWIPNPRETYVLFIIPVFWGLADAGWQIQINSIYGVLFPDTHEAAFSNFRLWESVGFAIAYGYASHLCTSVKLYLLLVYLTLGLIGYSAISILERNKLKIDKNQKKQELKQ